MGRQEAQAYVAEWGGLDIGATYTTDDNKTHINIKVTENTLSLYLYYRTYTISGSTYTTDELWVEWGDGTDGYYSNAGTTGYPGNASHTYATPGEYTIKVSINPKYGNNKIYGLCTPNNTVVNGAHGCIGKYESTNSFYNRQYMTYEYDYIIQSLEMGKHYKIMGGALNGCKAVKYYSMNNTTDKGMNSYHLFTDNSLKIIIMYGVTNANYGTTAIGEIGFNCFDLNYYCVAKNCNVQGMFTFYENGIKRLYITHAINNNEVRIHHLPYIEKIVGLKYPNTCQVELGGSQTASSPKEVWNSNYIRELDYSSRDDIRNWNGYSNAHCHGLVKFSFPQGSSGKAIGGSGIFADCTRLKEVVLWNPQNTNITSLPNYMFHTCYSIESFDFSQYRNLTSFGNGAFQNMYSLKEFKLPPNISSIGTACFATTTSSLTDLYFYSSTPPVLAASSVFNGLPTAWKPNFHIPRGSLSAYTGATNYPATSKVNYVEEDY